MIDCDQKSQNLETTRCPSTEEWMMKMWFIYKMEYYTAEKNNDFMKFAGKWMELENVILSEWQGLSVNLELANAAGFPAQQDQPVSTSLVLGN
ncbi:hypothetical protein STEG23_033883 [Scotinomys teguina]